MLQDKKIDTNIDTGCTKEFPNRCGDGSCKKLVKDCPLVHGCNSLKHPYKCNSGSCVVTKDQCSYFDQNFTKCAANLNRCEDGFCRHTCPEFDGCPLSKPLKCPNGLCANFYSECSGSNDCPHNTPFRCSSGVCAASFSECKRGFRTYISEDLIITNSPLESQERDFIADPESMMKYGKFEIPASALFNV